MFKAILIIMTLSIEGGASNSTFTQDFQTMEACQSFVSYYTSVYHKTALGNFNLGVTDFKGVCIETKESNE